MKRLMLFTAAVVISLFIVEALTRLLLPRPGFQTFPRNGVPGLAVPHPTRHFYLAPNFGTEVDRGSYRFDVVTNSLGLRDDQVRSGERIDILAAGDSYTWGFGVQAEDAWPSQLESYINSVSGSIDSVRVLNAGIGAYNIAQIRDLIGELTYLEPRIVVLGLFVSGYRRLNNTYVYFEGYAVLKKMTTYLATTEDGFLLSRYGSERMRRVHWWLMEHFYFGAHLMETARAIRWRFSRRPAGPASFDAAVLNPFLDELGAINRICKNNGIGLVVLLVNPQEEDGSYSTLQKEYNSTVQSFCTGSDITFFDPIPYFETAPAPAEGAVFRRGVDPHWSKRAHALVGRELGAFLMREDWIK